MADLELLDRVGDQYIHEPNDIDGWLHVDGKYLAHVHVFESSKATITTGSHSLSFRPNKPEYL